MFASGLYGLFDSFPASSAGSVVNRVWASAARTRPLLLLIFQKSIHPFIPNHPQILKRRFPVRILRCISDLLLHDVVTRIVRAFVTVCISVLSALSAENDAAVFRAELRLIVIRSVAPLTWVVVCERLRTDIAVQSARSDHFCFEHLISLPFRVLHPFQKRILNLRGTAFPAQLFCGSR